jgi:glycerol-1-phosphate dehydrogenase [NAD(P)+]
MENCIPIYVGNDAVSKLLEYCGSRAMHALALVADDNTYSALGQELDQALRAQGHDVETIVFSGDDIVADEHYVAQLLVRGDAVERVYVAVGSGTVTDLARFVSHRTRVPFISVPTAPSVDGYTSIGAPLVIDRIKQTLVTQPPLAVFADLPTLCAAPRRMIASGCGDILGKFTSLADWRLGHLVWDEKYDETIAQRAQRAVESCAGSVEEIGKSTEDGIRRLMDGLIESGLCMLDFGDTMPASGSEHHLSHFWEMRLIWEGRRSLLHGAKVGVACVLMAELYDRVKHLSQRQAAQLMDSTPRPDREEQVQRIREAYGPIADTVLATQAPFLELDDGAYRRLKQRIVEAWPDIQDLAAHVPPAHEIAGM